MRVLEWGVLIVGCTVWAIVAPPMHDLWWGAPFLGGLWGTAVDRFFARNIWRD